MTSYFDAEPFIITTDTNTNKNLSSEVYDFSQSSISVGVGSFATRTYSIPLSTATRLYQIYVNISTEPDVWVAMPARDKIYTNRTIAMNVSQNGANLTLNVYYVNTGASTQTFPASTIKVARRDFVDEVL